MFRILNLQRTPKKPAGRKAVSASKRAAEEVLARHHWPWGAELQDRAGTAGGAKLEPSEALEWAGPEAGPAPGLGLGLGSRPRPGLGLSPALLTPSTATTLSVVRIALSYGAGFGFVFMLHSAVMIHRPDIVDGPNRVRDTPISEMRAEYDFVIVGGGSAGCVLANRLSEEGNWSVLLLEAGGDETVLSDLPLLFPSLQLTPLDWQFKTEPSDSYCLAMNGQRCNWPRGRALGGSSTINAMLYVRGNRRDYDQWAELGNPGWSYEEVLPYFKKSEDMTIAEFYDPRFHARGGPLTVEEYGYHSQLTETFMEAVRELGYPIGDFNGARQSVFMRSHGTLRNGLRCSTAKAFLRPAARRPNLQVPTRATAPVD
ncbi:glucose dehydrogenase [FAD, quinone]-like [Gryllus bimaculatus]|nr:glucose dehydrogenase [FAD, quinone]-like [Gryllus bimaculatus]